MHVSFLDQQESVDGNLVLAVSELADKLGKRLLPKKKTREKDNMSWTGGEKKRQNPN